MSDYDKLEEALELAASYVEGIAAEEVDVAVNEALHLARQLIEERADLKYRVEREYRDLQARLSAAEEEKAALADNAKYWMARWKRAEEVVNRAKRIGKSEQAFADMWDAIRRYEEEK